LAWTRIRFYCRGTRVTVHLFCILVLGWVVFTGRLREMILVLGALVTHEMAHYIVLRGYGMGVASIDVLPFGARMEIGGMSGRPDAEAPIAAAGPLNNFILLALGLLFGSLGMGGGYWWEFFLSVNLALALLNLIPALPLDGGRILRGYLAETAGVVEATRIMAQWGVGCGAALIVATVYLAMTQSMYLWVVGGAGIILVVAALQERSEAPTAALGNLFRRQISRCDRRSPPPVEHVSAYEDETAARVSRRLGRYGFAIIWILDEDLRLLGTLTEEELRRAVTSGRADLSLKHLLNRK